MKTQQRRTELALIEKEKFLEVPASMYIGEDMKDRPCLMGLWIKGFGWILGGHSTADSLRVEGIFKITDPEMIEKYMSRREGVFSRCTK